MSGIERPLCGSVSDIEHPTAWGQGAYAPVISAMKKSSDMTIMIMSRVFLLRENAMMLISILVPNAEMVVDELYANGVVEDLASRRYLGR